MQADQPSIGTVTAVSGNQMAMFLRVEAFKRDGGDSATAPLNVGAILKIETDQSTVYAMLSSIVADERAARGDEAGGFIGQADLVGEVAGDTGTFQRGVSRHPSLWAPVHRATLDDVALIYDCGEEAKVRIGSLLHDRSLAAHVMIDLLLSRHFAILGTTGSAESAISQHIRRDQGVRLVQKPFDPMNLADEVRAAINA